MTEELDFTRFQNLFKGFEKAYGTSSSTFIEKDGKNKAITDVVRKPTGDMIFKKHLDGELNLRIVPLLLNGKCNFGCIDIDKSHSTNPLRHTHEELEKIITDLELPLIVCRSKSNAVHLYCFLKEEVCGKLLKNKLKEWAVEIDYKGVEVFPNQITRHSEKDFGQAITIPYFDYKQSKRTAINNGKDIDFKDFLDLAESQKISLKQLKDIKGNNSNCNSDLLDAPPCIGILLKDGIQKGDRTKGLFNIAIYLKKKFDNNYEEKLLKINTEICQPLLNVQELSTITSSINKKDYSYMCGESPICDLCDKKECFKRKYGYGSTSKSKGLDLSGLIKYVAGAGSSVSWSLMVEGHSVELTTDELLGQAKMRKKILEASNFYMPTMKGLDFNIKVENLISNVQIINDPMEASPQGQFERLLENFLSNTTTEDSQTRDLISKGLYEKNGLIYFRSENLFLYLKNKRFTHNEHQIWKWLKALGGFNEKFSVGGKTINVWCIKAFNKYKEEEELL